MNNGKILTVRLSEALHKNLEQRAETEGGTISDIARTIITEHVRVEDVASHLSKLEELDIGRRFRELYAQARIANHSLDALARTMLGDKYHAWRTAVNQSIEQEVAKRKSEMEKTR
jgi:predicted transcriptional regulator